MLNSKSRPKKNRICSEKCEGGGGGGRKRICVCFPERRKGKRGPARHWRWWGKGGGTVVPISEIKPAWGGSRHQEKKKKGRRGNGEAKSFLHCTAGRGVLFMAKKKKGERTLALTVCGGFSGKCTGEIGSAGGKKKKGGENWSLPQSLKIITKLKQGDRKKKSDTSNQPLHKKKGICSASKS